MTHRADPPHIILASNSPYRRQQLEAWKIPFTALSPRVDEEHLKEKLATQPVEQLCLTLAREKAESIIDEYPHALVIGSDQVAFLEGKILGKPGTFDNAQRQLSQLSGKTHSLITGVFVTYRGQTVSFCEEIKITLKVLSVKDIKDYLHWDQPLNCAGSYRFEKSGICLVESLEGNDPSSILGLPMMGLCASIEQLTGHKPFSLYPLEPETAPVQNSAMLGGPRE